MKALRPLTASLMLLTSCLLISNTTLAKTTLKLSHNQDKSHAVHKALSYLADKTKEYSNGELVIRIYPNATLGNERESLELMNSGALQMVKVNAASLESFAPDYSLFSLPFLFRDRDHYYRVLQSDLGKKILNSSESKGFVGITYYDGGARSFYSNKPITKPEDLAGMKIRVQQSPSAIAMMKASNVLVICPYFRSIPMDIPESARVDMMEISIPPTSMTHSIPSDITIVTALFFSISMSDFGVRNDGLIAVTTANSTITIIASRASREPVIFLMTDFFSII